MAGELDLKTGLLTQAPTGSTINNGIVTPNTPVPVLPQPNTRSLISQTAQPGYIQGYDTQQGYAPVFVPKGQYVPGISATPNKMTTDSLQSSSGIKLPPVEQPLSQADATIAGGKASIDSIMQEFTPQVSETQQKAQGVNDLIASLTKDLENKGVDQLSTEQSAGIPELKTQFAEINSLMSTRLAEYNALLSQNKNKPVTMSSIIGSERAILDAKASDIGLLQAQAEGLKGRIQIAQDTANRAVDLKYSTIEARLNTYEAQLRALEPTLSKEEKQQALAQQVLLDQKKQEIADKKEKEKSIQNAMMDYFNAGGTDTKVTNAISSAKTVEEAQRLAGMQVAKTVQEDRSLDMQIKKAQLADIYDEMANRGIEENEVKIIKINGIDYVQNEDGSFSVPVLPEVATEMQQEKTIEIVNLIKELKEDPYLTNAVGPISSKLPTLKGGTADFQAKFNNLIAKIAIDNLNLLKGPMSDKDIQFIKEQASALNLGMSEAGFKKELEKLETKFSEVQGKINTSPSNNDISNKIKEAQTQGYKPEEIINFLSSDPAVSEQIKEAKSSGYSDQQIMEHLQSFNKPLSVGSSAQKIASAIGQFESGGNYTARGPEVDTGMYKGQRAVGKYQIMPGNIPQWSKEALGREVSLQEFINNPKIQDQIAEYKMGKIYKQYGTVEDVASVWFSGRPLAKAGNAKDVIGTSVPNYVKNVISIYKKLS